jgi:diguanylate cyclase (GGDEF)-like protein/PAS domain S-box-containing protein
MVASPENRNPDLTLLVAGVDHLDVGLTVFDADLRLVMANRRMTQLFGFPAVLLEPGTPLAALFRFNAERGEYGPGNIDELTEARLTVARRFEAHSFERKRPDGTMIKVRGTPLPQGGFVTIYTDVTRQRRNEMDLRLLAEELEQRVADRTAEVARQSALLQQIVTHIHHGITLVNKDLVLEVCNPQFAQIMRFPPEIARPGRSFEEFIRYNAERGEYGDVDTDSFVALRVEQARRLEPHHFERTRPDGSSVEVTGAPTGDGGFVSTYMDITERKRAEAALQASEQRFRDFAHAASDWFFETDADLRFTYFSERILEVSGLPFKDVLGKRRQQVAVPGATDQEPEKWHKHLDDLAHHRPYRDFQYPLLARDGRVAYISVSGVPVFDDAGLFKGYRGTGTDITELYEARQSLERMAHHDPLTGIPNRRYFERMLEDVLARAARYRQRGALIYFDLDRFKFINDQFGHAAGDELLKNIAGGMMGRLRRTDFVARIGGDEFALIYERIEDDRMVSDLAHELIARVAEIAADCHPGCGVGASAGIVFFGTDEVAVGTLMRKADAAMYAAKATGRGAVCIAPT